MRTIQGVSVSAGIAIGTVRVLAAVDYAVERRLIDDPQAEMDRFRAARDTAVAQLKQLRDNVAAEFGENKAELFDAHRLMLQDPDYAECVEGLIAQDKVNAESAVKSAAEQFAAMFAAMDSSTMQARAADVKDVSRRVMNVLQGKRDSTAQDGSVQGDAVQNGIVQNGIAQNGESHIIFAEDLAPSDTAQLDRAKVLGLVTAKGSANSHTAILARTMGLPAITGIGDAFDPADDGHVAVIDGTSEAGALPVDISQTDVYYFSPQKAFGADGGLWVAILSPEAIDRAAGVESSAHLEGAHRWVPPFLSLTTALNNSRKDQTLNTPAVATLIMMENQIRWLNNNGGLAWATTRCAKSASILYSWAERSEYAAPFVVDADARSNAVVTIDLDERVQASQVLSILRENGIVDAAGYRKLGRNQLRVGVFPSVEPADVMAFTKCVDYVVEHL